MLHKLNLIAFYSLLTFCFLIIIQTLAAEIKNEPPVKEVTGKIFKKEKIVSCGLYKAELILNNKIINSKFVDDEMPFSFIISGQKDYIIRISKNGYTTKHVKISSVVPQYIRSKGYFIYDCIIEMEKETLTMGVR